MEPKPTLNIREEFEKILHPILSPRQSFELVEGSLMSLDSEDFGFALHWLKVTSVSNIELAYAYARKIGEARSKLPLKGVQLWIHDALALYDQEGLYPAIKALEDLDDFIERRSRATYSCRLEEVKPKLEIFIRGLAGRGLQLKHGKEVFTDTEYLYLPKTISRYRDKKKNAALYKSYACFLWAQTWYGTFKKQTYTSDSTRKRLERYADSEKARQYFLSLENIRLLACIQRELPGLYREMHTLFPVSVPRDKTWKMVCQRLERVGASVEDTFDAVDLMMRLRITLPDIAAYQGNLNLSAVEEKVEQRKSDLLSEVEDLVNNRIVNKDEIEQMLDSFNNPARSSEDMSDSQYDDGKEDSEGALVSKDSGGNERLTKILEALMQDVAQLDDSLFETLGEGGDNGNVGDAGQQRNKLDEVDLSARESILELDEWDYLRDSYRKRWCHVNIRTIEPLENNFRQQTIEKYPYLISQIRKVFEAMRDQPRYANRQTDGDEIDLDAAVDTYRARIAGEELSERMYIRRQQNERNVATCLLVDMSGSTKGWINLAMRESLILFGEALNTLGDQYAIIGFSGLTRQRCEIYTVKEFSENSSQMVNARIANIQAKDYTRMGFAVRYATDQLLKTEARHRVLLLLSDGKPDDYDGYQGEYGIQDTRKAILEAQGHAIRPYSVTIDKQAQDYLPRLFGPGQYMILNHVAALPLKLTEVYRKLSM